MFNKYFSKKVSTVTLVESGFTIIELMVVMAIIGILMPLGISSFVNTRRSREVSEASANARDAIKNARAMALSVSSDPTSSNWPVAYEVYFSGSEIITNIKYSNSGSGENQFSEWSITGIYFDIQNSALELSPVNTVFSGCDRIVFSSVNGEMYIYNGDYMFPVANCTIDFTSGNKTRTLVLNASEKRFEIN